VTIHSVSRRVLLVFLLISVPPASFSNSADRFRSYLCVFTSCSCKLGGFSILADCYLSPVHCYFQPVLFRNYGDWTLTRLSGCCQMLDEVQCRCYFIHTASLYPPLMLFPSLISASFANICRMQGEICGSHSGFAEEASLLGCDSVPLGERFSAFREF